MKVGRLTLYRPFCSFLDIFICEKFCSTLFVQMMLFLMNGGLFIFMANTCTDKLISAIIYLLTTLTMLLFARLCVSNPGIPDQIIDKALNKQDNEQSY